MWPWKKRDKPSEPDEPRSETPRFDLPLATMSIVARPIPPRDRKPPEPTPDDRNDPREERGEVESGLLAPGDWPPSGGGTSNAAAKVGAGMEHTSSSASPRSFDPSKAATSTLISLQSVQIATPCRADWNKMDGDSKSRFCQTCRKSVYNLSAMTTPEAQELMARKGGDLCARIYRRADGTVITGDCPVGSTAPRRSPWSAGAGLAAIFAALVSGCGSNASATGASAVRLADTFERWRDVPVVGALVNKFAPVSVVAGGISAPAPPVMGKIACPAPTPAPTAAPAEEPEPTPILTPNDSVEMGEIAASPPVAGA